MIDIHSHILYGLDDGARTFEESLEMVRMAAAGGTTDIVASPHANEEYHFEPEAVEARISELQSAAGDSPVIHYGCDFHLTPENIEDALRSPGKYSIGHRGYLLVEFSDFLIPKTTSQIFAALLAAGMRPIITHPERNRLLRGRIDEMGSWVQLGCLIQVTAQSLLGRFGKSAQDASAALMKRGLVHVLASDGHDLKHRPPVLNEAHQHLLARFGEETARRLCVSNPRAIIDGRSVEPVSPPEKTRPWHSWWRKNRRP
jgi:protein-tyrosine phosphatase